MKPNTDKTSPEDTPCVRPLADALFAAEAVAHLRGYEREILPLADLARSMDEDIVELRAALATATEALAFVRTDVSPECEATVTDAIDAARAVLKKTKPRKQP